MTELKQLIERAIASQLDDRLDDALKLYSQALQQRPNMPAIRQLLGQLIEYHFNLADTLSNMGRHQAAIPVLERVARAQPGIPRTHSLLGQLYITTGDPERATLHLRRYLELDRSDAAGAGLLLAHLGAGDVPPMPSASYVREFYDGYADTYDEHLLKDLGYRCPELIRAALERRGLKELRMLDLGCGTGLCGPAVQSFATRLDGVDLSGPMLAKARARGIYTHLEESDVIGFLHRKTDDYDAIVAAGLFEHIGDPAPLFVAARSALSQDGALIITAEASDGDTVQVNESGFFTHSEHVIREAARQAGLDVVFIEQAIMRHDAGERVSGLIACMTPA